MSVVPLSAPFLAGVPEVFTSPFPSGPDTLGKLRQLTGDAGVYSASQARSWQDVTQIAMRTIATSAQIGGIRQKVMPELVEIDAGIAGDVVKGIFGRADWPASTDPKVLGLAAAAVALNVAVDLVSAVPVFGGIAKAAVAIGKMMWALGKRDEVEQELIVPWQEFTGKGDEDSINSELWRNLVGSVDWTQYYMPPLNSAAGWKIAKTKKGGNTRSWGPFSPSGGLDYVGFGMMPGTQRMVDVIQMAPIASGPGWVRDAITNVGDFYPAMAQFGTASWSWACKLDGIGMYSIKAGELDEAWAEYWGSYFEDGLGALASMSDRMSLDARFVAKALLKQIVMKFADGTKVIGFPEELLTTGGNYGEFVNAEMWKHNPFGPQKLSTPYDAIVGPALRRLQRRQLASLAKTLACAYVRPEPVGSLPAHAAFLDRSHATDPRFATFGEQLVAKCLQCREILLTVDALWDVNMNDARAADPAFAERMAEKRGPVGSVRLTAGPQKALVAVPRPPHAEPPEGGAPFDGVLVGVARNKARPKGMSTAGKVILAGGALGVAGYAMTR